MIRLGCDAVSANNSIRYLASEFGIYTSQSNGFNVYTNSDSESSLAEFTITDGGLVGIAAESPSAMLHASSTSATTITGILQGAYSQTPNLL